MMIDILQLMISYKLKLMIWPYDSVKVGSEGADDGCPRFRQTPDTCMFPGETV